MSEGYDVQFSNPLERLLDEYANGPDAANNFPPCGQNRFDLYKRIKADLNEKIYRDVDGALTADSGGGAFTRHDLGHVNDVIRRVGQVLGAGSDAKEPAFKKLTHYEVFVLLVACLVHDAGNVFGREGHAAKARGILRKICGETLGQKELSLISKVAQAHGGKAQDGSKDTIGALLERDGVEGFKVRLRRLAALLRYGDELAENHRRANNRDVQGSAFPNNFCQCIDIGVDYDNRRVSLDFTLSDKGCEWLGKDENGKKMFFIDYIRERVIKAELERRYCDQFLRGFATFSETRITIEFLHDNHEWRDQIAFVLSENGYPTAKANILPKSKLDGQKIATSYASFKEEAEKDG